MSNPFRHHRAPRPAALTLAATAIVAQPATLTGSIGVFGGKLNILGLYRKLGINVETVSRGLHAEMLSPFKDFTPEEAERYQAQLDDTYRTFLARVSAGRRVTPAYADSVGQGRVWSGRAAFERSLVGATQRSSTSVTTPAATSSPRRSAKKERPLSTLSPLSVKPRMPRNWAVTHGSSTTVSRSLGGFVAPRRRVARRPASAAQVVDASARQCADERGDHGRRGSRSRHFRRHHYALMIDGIGDQGSGIRSSPTRAPHPSRPGSSDPGSPTPDPVRDTD